MCFAGDGAEIATAVEIMGDWLAAQPDSRDSE
jgi:hypothetical protein